MSSDHCFRNELGNFLNCTKHARKLTKKIQVFFEILFKKMSTDHCLLIKKISAFNLFPVRYPQEKAFPLRLLLICRRLSLLSVTFDLSSF